jgi:starch synthase (maltosyl-transferring)
MGFDDLALAPLFAPGPSGDPFLAGDIELAPSGVCDKAARGAAPMRSGIEVVGEIGAACQSHGLGLILDAVIDRVDAKGALALSNPHLFESIRAEILNPRSTGQFTGAAVARFDRPDLAEQLIAFWTERLSALLKLGVTGFRFLNPANLPVWLWRSLIRSLREAYPRFLALAYTPGMTWRDIEALATVEFDGVFSSLAWWDRRANWFAEELDVLRRVAPIISCPEILPPNRPGAGESKETYRQKLEIAAATADALMIPLAPEPRHDTVADREQPRNAHPLPEQAIRAAIERLAHVGAVGVHGEVRALSEPGEPVTALIWHDASNPLRTRKAVVVLINLDLGQNCALDFCLNPLPPAAGASLGRPTSLNGSQDIAGPLAPGEVRAMRVERLPSAHRRQRRRDLSSALEAPRIVIEAVMPAVNGGAFAAKHLCGEPVAVEADIFTDGHGVLDAELLWKAADESDWHRVPMRAGENDRWHGTFTPGRVGRYSFTIEAWLDDFASLCRDIAFKQRAGTDVALEIGEARLLVKRAAAEAGHPEKSAISSLQKRLAATKPTKAIDILLAPETAATMRQAAPRRFKVQYQNLLRLEVERPQAEFAAWYELFPRSASLVKDSHGTFDDVIQRLPEIRAMGFDVLYLPPIHPIGRTNRKGRNNSLTAGRDDPGSPYAIGAEEGGHDAIHPELGSFDDFRRLITAAAEAGMEIALDFAIQCSPDHPWLKEHPNWFGWRPDGSLRFAENPPKKYEDIVNVEFYPKNDDGAALWTALRNIVLFWIEERVRIFRVDNPHTKPLPFWEWLIADIRARHPDTIFLSEAFTRPKMMYRLAKLGFSQSYTYFTWRNSKRELIDYMTELTTPPVVEFFRPHFFVNTPDINPFFLQHSGRAGFLIRAALAATLSGLWGIYSGFELCEATPLPGREEYLDAEKFEIKHRDPSQARNIIAEIAALNRIRRAHPSLQSHKGLKFYNAYNDQVLVYGKASASHADMILIAVSLDPHHVQEATFEVPLWEWGLSDDASLIVEDLLRNQGQMVWHGKLQRVRLDPAGSPYAIWHIAPLWEGRP